MNKTPVGGITGPEGITLEMAPMLAAVEMTDINAKLITPGASSGETPSTSPINAVVERYAAKVGLGSETDRMMEAAADEDSDGVKAKVNIPSVAVTNKTPKGMEQRAIFKPAEAGGDKSDVGIVEESIVVKEDE